MASDDCVAAFSAQIEAPLAPYYGSDLVVMGKRILMSQFSSNFDRHLVEEALQQLFPAHAQLVLMPSSDGSPLSLERMSYDQILEAVEFTVRNETYGIVSIEKRIELENLKAQYDSATNSQEKDGCLDLIRDLIHSSVLSLLSNCNLKGFGSYLDNQSGFQMLLLDNRKTYTADQGKVKAIAARIKRTKDRANLKSTKLPARSPSGKLRKQISDSDTDSSQASSTTLDVSCHGKHTSSDSEFEEQVPTKAASALQEGSAQLPASQPGPNQQSAIAAATALLSSQLSLNNAGPPSLTPSAAVPIPKRKRLSKKDRKAAKAAKHAAEKDKSKSDNKLTKKSRKAKKGSKKSKKHASSSSDQSSSSSDEDSSTSSSEQVFSHSPLLLVVL